MVFFMLFHVGFTSVMLGAFKFVGWTAAEHPRFAAFSAMVCIEQNTIGLNIFAKPHIILA